MVYPKYLLLFFNTSSLDVTVLKEDGTLYASGIVRIDWTDRDLVRMLSLLGGMGTALLREEADSKTMFQTYFTPLQQSSLTPEDFPHLQEDFHLLQGILKNAIEHKGSKE